MNSSEGILAFQLLITSVIRSFTSNTMQDMQPFSTYRSSVPRFNRLQKCKKLIWDMHNAKKISYHESTVSTSHHVSKVHCPQKGAQCCQSNAQANFQLFVSKISTRKIWGIQNQAWQTMTINPRCTMDLGEVCLQIQKNLSIYEWPVYTWFIITTTETIIRTWYNVQSMSLLKTLWHILETLLTQAP